MAKIADPIAFELFKNAIFSIAEEMGRPVSSPFDPSASCQDGMPSS